MSEKFHDHCNHHPSAVFFNGIRLNLFCRVLSVIPIAIESKVTTEPRSAVLGRKMFPALYRCKNLFLCGSSFEQSLLGMGMQADFFRGQVFKFSVLRG